MTESSTPKRGPSQGRSRKPTGGTPAASGTSEPSPTPEETPAASEPPAAAAPFDLLRDFRDMVDVLARDRPAPGTAANRLLAQHLAGMVIALALLEEPGIDITAIRVTPYPFAYRDLDVTVATQKDGEALLAYIKAYGGASAPIYSAKVLGHRDPTEVHHQWELVWRELAIRVGTVIQPDDAYPETPSPEATSGEDSTTTMEEA